MEILDGKMVSAKVLENIKNESVSFIEKEGRPPGLAVVIVGDDPASAIYVRSKERKAKKLGFRSEVISLGSSVSDEELTSVIARLNKDNNTDGILVQLPLPDGFDTWKYLDMIDPEKDVDRFHPVNLGKIMLGRTNIYPCTPSGVVRMLDEFNIDVTGMNCVVLGRSYIVGKPMASMLTNRNATVTICHSRTKNIPDILSGADMIVSAIGSPGFVKADMVKDGAILIDVGINRVDTREEAEEFCTPQEIEKFEKKGYAITGDIHPEAFKKSSFYTPVPGGVGLMTVAMLMDNTFRLFMERTGN
ncbi:MAG: bifunctional 5,10-methylenetetrahydrofolate dehydrogenase/5,10-methenyltetrahydrofolate cyclohydrolase [Candidatus Aminicenantes bacterium]|nr:bifunctional 5,10-methylenetetrahydrofolate dehydrogenase/5,10-methenyltetrahydrofolate cyclohydrolase [Candidatus Aminicenantes bacterium]